MVDPKASLEAARKAREHAQAAQKEREFQHRIHDAEAAGGMAISPKKLHPYLAEMAVQEADHLVERLEAEEAVKSKLFQGSGRCYYDAGKAWASPVKSPSRSGSRSPQKATSPSDQAPTNLPRVFPNNAPASHAFF